MKTSKNEMKILLISNLNISEFRIEWTDFVKVPIKGGMIFNCGEFKETVGISLNRNVLLDSAISL